MIKFLITFLHHNTRYKTIGIVLVSLMIIPLLLVLIQSFQWYFVVDSPVLQYVAFLILHGKIPYKDIFDMNLPGTYLLHIFCIKVFGTGDLAFRLFDLTCLSITCFSIFMILKRVNKFAAFIGIVIFASIHLAGGEYSMGQRDFLMLPFLAISVFFSYQAIYRKKPILFLLVGLLQGYAATIKPTIPLMSIFIFAIFIFIHKKEKKKIIYSILYFIASFAVFPLIILLWLKIAGGLSAFAFIFLKYIPTYNSIIRRNPIVLLNEILSTPLFILLVLILLSAAFYSTIIYKIKNNERSKILYLLMIAGIIYGFVHYMMQGTKWPYHLYPLYFFAAVFCAMIFGDLMSADDIPAKRFAITGIFVLSAFISVVTIKTFLHLPNSINGYEFGIAGRKRLIGQLKQDLSGVVNKNDTIQVFDFCQGGESILYRLQLYQPTRFVQEIHFTLGNINSRPLLNQLWEEYITAMRTHPPKLIIAFSSSAFFNKQQCTSQQYAMLCNFINANYEAKMIRTDYTVYFRKGLKIKNEQDFITKKVQ